MAYDILRQQWNARLRPLPQTEVYQGAKDEIRQTMKNHCHKHQTYNRRTHGGFFGLGEIFGPNNIEGNEETKTVASHYCHAWTPLWRHDWAVIRLPAKFLRKPSNRVLLGVILCLFFNIRHAWRSKNGRFLTLLLFACGPELRSRPLKAGAARVITTALTQYGYVNGLRTLTAL